MEKVKIFTRGSGDAHEKLEKQVNEWLAENEGTEIISRHVTGAAGAQTVFDRNDARLVGFVNCTIVIFYRKRS